MVKWIEFNISGLLMVELMNKGMFRAEMAGHDCLTLFRVRVRGSGSLVAKNSRQKKSLDNFARKFHLRPEIVITPKVVP